MLTTREFGVAWRISTGHSREGIPRGESPVWSCVDNARKPALASWDPGEWVGLGGEILTFPDTLTTQGLSLWSMVFQHSDTRAYN